MVGTVRRFRLDGSIDPNKMELLRDPAGRVRIDVIWEVIWGVG